MYTFFIVYFLLPVSYVHLQQLIYCTQGCHIDAPYMYRYINIYTTTYIGRHIYTYASGYSILSTIAWLALKSHVSMAYVESNILNHSTASVNTLRPSDAYMRRWSNHHWFRWRLVAWSAPSHYLNQCWNIVNRTLGNELQWNFNRNWNISIEENTFENVVCEMASILSRPQRVKHSTATIMSPWLLGAWCQGINTDGTEMLQIFFFLVILSYIYWWSIVGSMAIAILKKGLKLQWFYIVGQGTVMITIIPHENNHWMKYERLRIAFKFPLNT